MGPNEDCGVSCLRRFSVMVGEALKKASGAILEVGSNHPLRVGLGLGLILIVALMLLGPVLVVKLSSESERDWLSFWTSWLPGVFSVGLAFGSIFITICIARAQGRQDKFLSRMQTQLTLAMNLPPLLVTAVEFYSRDACIEVLRSDRHKLGMMFYRFVIFFPSESLPANYKAVLEQISWKFPDLEGRDGIPQGLLDPDSFDMHIYRGSGGASMWVDFKCPEDDRSWFEKFYMYPYNRSTGENHIELTLRLKLDDLLLNAVMHSTEVDAKAKVSKKGRVKSEPVEDGPAADSYDGRIDLYLCLYCQSRYLEGDPPKSPAIFVHDHSISGPDRMI